MRGAFVMTETEIADDIDIQANSRGVTVALDTDSSGARMVRYMVEGSPVVAYVRAIYYPFPGNWEARACKHDAFVLSYSYATGPTAEAAAARSLARALPLPEV